MSSVLEVDNIIKPKFTFCQFHSSWLVKIIHFSEEPVIFDFALPGIEFGGQPGVDPKIIGTRDVACFCIELFPYVYLVQFDQVGFPGINDVKALYIFLCGIGVLRERFLPVQFGIPEIIPACQVVFKSGNAVIEVAFPG